MAGYWDDDNNDDDWKCYICYILEDNCDDERVAEDADKEDNRINNQQEVDGIIGAGRSPRRVRGRRVQFDVFQVIVGGLHHVTSRPVASSLLMANSATVGGMIARITNTATL